MRHATVSGHRPGGSFVARHLTFGLLNGNSDFCGEADTSPARTVLPGLPAGPLTRDEVERTEAHTGDGTAGQSQSRSSGHGGLSFAKRTSVHLSISSVVASASGRAEGQAGRREGGPQLPRASAVCPPGHE